MAVTVGTGLGVGPGTGVELPPPHDVRHTKKQISPEMPKCHCVHRFISKEP